jgi:hypothetical protein
VKFGCEVRFGLSVILIRYSVCGALSPSISSRRFRKTHDLRREPPPV